MELAILFWCYKEVALCANRLRLLRHDNPDTPIYVLFGGELADAPRFENQLGPYADDFYAFPEERHPLWKWRHGDLLISRWFTDRGQRLRWDSIVVIQWDMLVFGPVEQLFGNLKKNELLLPGLRPGVDVDASWEDPDYFAFIYTRPEYPSYYDEYVEFLRENHLQGQDVWCCTFIVTVFPRAFLARFAARSNPGTGFLEYSVPTLAKSWGFDFCTAHPYSPWLKGSLTPYHRLLNSHAAECPDRDVLLQLLDPAGLRIFHPYSRDLPVNGFSRTSPAWLNFARSVEWDPADLFDGSTRALARHAIAGRHLVLPGPVPAHPTLCVSMLVRNDAHRIRGVLDAVAPHISSWVIVDTGSTDGTQDVIREHMAGLGISGELHERPRGDVGRHRTEALALAQDRADYIWVLEAGDMLVGTPDFAGLGAGIHWLRCTDDDGDAFWRAQLFRDGLRVRYDGGDGGDGGTWEHDDSDNPYPGVRIHGAYHVEVGRGRQAATRHSLTLIDEAGGREDARSVFAAASSHFARGDFTTARVLSARRIEMGGSDEEIYAALWMIAHAMANLGEPWLDVQRAFLRAWEFRPTRAEPLYAIASRYRIDRRYRLGHRFAERAAALPLPEGDTVFVLTDVYAWRAIDEQAVCASWIGKQDEAFMLYRRMLALSELPDEDRQRIAANRDGCATTMLEAADAYPEAVVRSLATRDAAGDIDVTVTLIAGPDRAATERTLNSFLNCCTDVKRVGRFLAVDAGLTTEDRGTLTQRYPFLEFTPPTAGARFQLHLGQGWQFFAPDNLITRLTAVLHAEPDVVRVGINLADATTLNGHSAPEGAVRRSPDTGRYVLTDTPYSGPAMVDTTRLDPAKESRTASLDEVFCIAAG